MKTRWAAPAAFMILLVALGGVLISADEPESPLPSAAPADGAAADRQLRFTVTKGDVQPLLDALRKSHPEVAFESDGTAVTARGSAAAMDSVHQQIIERGKSRETWPQGINIGGLNISGLGIAEAEPAVGSSASEPQGRAIVSGGRPSSSAGSKGDEADHSEMVLRLSAPDLVSGIRMSIGGQDAQKVLDALRKSDPRMDVTFEVDGNMIVARGSMAALRALRQRMLTLGETVEAGDLPFGLTVDLYGWREPGGTSLAQATDAEQTTIIQLEHLPVSSAADVLRNLFPSPPSKIHIGTERSTNTLILRGPGDQLEELQAILVKLDQPPREQPQPVQRRQGSPFGSAGTTSGFQAPVTAAPGQPDHEIRVYALQHASAEELAPTLRELYSEYVRVVIDRRTNSLLVDGPAPLLEKIEDLVRQLSQPATVPGTGGREATRATRPSEATEAEYAAAERRAAALAAQTEKTVRDIARLRTAVGQAFEWRQRHQRAELESLRRRLEAIERDIDRRDRIREAIVERRVEELLSGKQSATPEDTGRSDPVDKASLELAGVWRLSGETSNGKERNTGVTGTLTFRGNQVRSNLRNPGSDDALKEGVFRYFSVNPDKSPAEINLYGTNFLVQGIYKLAGDELTLAFYGRPEIGRPRSFAVEDVPPEGLSLVVMTFQKLDQSASVGSDAPYQRQLLLSGKVRSDFPDRPATLGIGMHGDGRAVTIQRVWPETGAEEAGLRVGDRILALDGHAVSEPQEVVDQTIWRNPGEEVTLLILRGDERLTVKVRLSDFHSSKEDSDATGVDAKGVLSGGLGSLSPQDKGRLGAGLASSADVAGAEAELSEAERHFDHTEAMVKKGYQRPSDLEVARRAVEAARARLNRVRREYEAQKRLLQLDVESAKLKVDAALKAFRQSSKGQGTTEQQFAVRQAELELQRAQTLLALHTGDLGESKDGEETPDLEAPEQNSGPGDGEADAAIWRSFGVRVRAMSKVGMPGDRYNGGLIIRDLRQDGPAANAGLQQGDIIIGVGKWETLSQANLLYALTSDERAGDSAPEARSVKVLFLRQAQLYTTTVTLGSSGHLPLQDDEDGPHTDDDTPKADVSPAQPATHAAGGRRNPLPLQR